MATHGAWPLVTAGSSRSKVVFVTYVAGSACAILLVWVVDLLEIITLASRAFAAYYLLQTLLAIIYNWKDCPPAARMTRVDQVLFVSLTFVLAYIIVFSIPAG